MSRESPLQALPPLSGRGILVTRPAARAGHFAQLIRAAGGEPVLFPCLEIVSKSVETPQPSIKYNDNVINGVRPDMLVFVSPTAVGFGFDAIRPLLPANLAAVGQATARTLQTRAGAPVLSPAGPEGRADSEALAALPELQTAAITGKHVLIVRGEGGRAWLGDTLRARGASVEYLECYRRKRPVPATEVLADLLARWRAGSLSAVTMTSREALDNLMAILPQEAHEQMKTTPLFATHPRIAAHARVLGMQQVLITDAGDEAMVAGLQSFFATVA